MFLTKTYELEDCVFYDSQTVDKQRYTVTSGGANITYSNDGVTISGTQATTCLVKNTALTLPTNYTAEVTITGFDGDVDGYHRTNYGGVCFDDCLLDFNSSNLNFYRFSTTTSLQQVSYSLQQGDVLKFEMNNGTMKISVNDVLKSTQSISNTGYYYNRTYKASGKTARSLTTKDLKVKPL